VLFLFIIQLMRDNRVQPPAVFRSLCILLDNVPEALYFIGNKLHLLCLVGIDHKPPKIRRIVLALEYIRFHCSRMIVETTNVVVFVDHDK